LTIIDQQATWYLGWWLVVVVGVLLVVLEYLNRSPQARIYLRRSFRSIVSVLHTTTSTMSSDAEDDDDEVYTDELYDDDDDDDVYHNDHHLHHHQHHHPHFHLDHEQLLGYFGHTLIGPGVLAAQHMSEEQAELVPNVLRAIEETLSHPPEVARQHVLSVLGPNATPVCQAMFSTLIITQDDMPDDPVRESSMTMLNVMTEVLGLDFAVEHFVPIVRSNLTHEARTNERANERMPSLNRPV